MTCRSRSSTGLRAARGRCGGCSGSWSPSSSSAAWSSPTPLSTSTGEGPGAAVCLQDWSAWRGVAWCGGAEAVTEPELAQQWSSRFAFPGSGTRREGCEDPRALPEARPAGDGEGRRVLPGPSPSPAGRPMATGLRPAPDLTPVAVAGTTWATGSWCKGRPGWKEPSWSRSGCASLAASPKRC